MDLPYSCDRKPMENKMKSNDKLDCLPEVKDKPYKKPEDGDLELLAEHLGGRLALRYGLAVLNKIDEANVPLKDTIYDAVYDYIDMEKLYEEYVEACGEMDFNWHNYYYGEVFQMLKKDGYVTWGDNYEIGSL